MSARDFLFIDTDATTTANFSYAYHDFCDHRLEQLASEVRTRYDLRFLCMPDFPHEDTWDRSGSVFRDAFQRRIEADLITRRLPYIRLRGTVDERMSVVKQTLANFQKFARS